MRQFAEVLHSIDINAPIEAVRSQFADLDHHIGSNVHPKLSFEILQRRANGARFVQVVRLLGIRQRDVFERTINADGSIHDLSVDGFNKDGSLDFRFEPVQTYASAGTSSATPPGTRVSIAIRLPVPPLLGWLKPLLVSQIRREVSAAALEDKFDLEIRGYPAATHA